MFSRPFKDKCISDVVRIGVIIIAHLRKLWKAKFFKMCDVTFLVRLQGKFDIAHSVQEWTGHPTHFRSWCIPCRSCSSCQNLLTRRARICALTLQKRAAARWGPWRTRKTRITPARRSAFSKIATASSPSLADLQSRNMGTQGLSYTM